MKYFTLNECTQSATARARRIDNTPNSEHLAHIRESIETLVDPLREAWGDYCHAKKLGTAGIRISSGYRGPKLNAAVGGSRTSAHCYGYTFDLVPMNRMIVEFKRFCREHLKGKKFDQLISEGENGNAVPRWMHVGYKSPRGEQRRQLLTMRQGKYYPMTK